MVGGGCHANNPLTGLGLFCCLLLSFFCFLSFFLCLPKKLSIAPHNLKFLEPLLIVSSKDGFYTLKNHLFAKSKVIVRHTKGKLRTNAGLKSSESF